MKFAEIIGQEASKKRLIKSVKDNRISHAQLFLSSEGSGALPLAIAYAQYISCENKQENDSCGICKSCIKYQKLVHPDLHFVFPIVKTTKKSICDNYLIEWRDFFMKQSYFSLQQWLENIEADNKQGLIYSEESNEILKKLSFKTFESDYKIMIIWLPEKMHTTGANKLLKILEEPYDKTIFLLVAEDVGQMLQTIISRTQLIKIPTISKEDVNEFLVQKIQLDKTTALNLAILSEGNIVTALKLINSTEEINVNFQLFVKIMRLTYTRNIAEINQFTEEISKRGRERQKSFLTYSIQMLRNNFILNQKTGQEIPLTSDETDFSKKFNVFISSNNIASINEEFSKAYYHIERNGNSRFIFLELALKLTKLLKQN
ncbi:MAG: hypothetical protein A2265_05340 [Bacteroidetes bacterium RIFOXYA12_FULL_33_9]|nr:MAG: hypothetical protein A2265_05340 [Bacteroidetes bacterium RIFOXYA12_FULL_33_9]